MGIDSHKRIILTNNFKIIERIKYKKDSPVRKGNIIRQGVWTLYEVFFFILNVLNANEQRMTASERHSIVEVTAGLNQPAYRLYIARVSWLQNGSSEWEIWCVGGEETKSCGLLHTGDLLAWLGCSSLRH